MGALDALLDHIISLVKAALGQALTTFISAIDAFGLSIASSLSEAVADVTAGQAVTQTHAAAFWDTLTGSLFLTGVALATIAEVVIGIMTPFTLGATFLVGIVIGLLLSAALQALEESAVAHTPVPSSGITAFNAEAIYSCEAIVNATNPPPRSESNWSTDWNALAGTPDWITTLFGSQLGLGLLAAAYYDRNGLVLSSVSFGLGLVGIALSIAGVSTGNRLVQETNVGISITSAALDGVDIVLYPADRVGPLGILNGVTLSMDSISAGIGFAEFYSEG